jgi:cytochrome c2
MKPGIACATCHAAGKSESEESLFISLMNDPQKTGQIIYNRCDSCHVVTGSSDD